MKLKKLLLLALIAFSTASYSQYNYGEALQKSILFYEAQQSGPIPDWNRLNWRGDSAMDDGSDVGHNLTGGWYDAGDHVKFGFPMAYSATVLAWGAIEYEAAYNASGQMEHLKNNLRFVCDYFIKAHTAPNEFYGQLGNGSADHAWWGAAEVMRMDRPAYKIDASNPGSDLAGETAAALAAASIVFADSDPSYSATLLSHAEQLYSFADTYRGKYSDSITDATAFYNSWSGYQDEIVWGAIWLYKATGNSSYLTKATTEYAFLGNEGQTNFKAYKWGLAWDDKSYGCYVLMSDITGETQYKEDAERHLDYWTTGFNGETIPYSPGGQAHLTTWGSLRHTANTSFLAFIYSDKVATTKANIYHDFAVSQLNYILGDNPNNRSYMMGFGNNPPLNAHHRTAHGTWTNNLNGDPVNNRHTLYGALVGGPGTPDDSYTDDRSDYVANEVACDYNACFTGALARMYSEFGGSVLTNFPQPETPVDEFLSDAKFNSNNDFGVTVSVFARNHTAWPARATTNLSFRYYFDISEGVDAGYSINDYSINLSYSEGNGVLSVNEVGDNVYYAEVSFPGEDVRPGGESESRREAQINIQVSSGMPWDNSNDYSAQGLNTTDRINSENIPIYDGGVLVFGNEPDGGDAPNAVFTATPEDGGIAPLEVDFDASDSSDPNGDALTYSWDFGDGNTGTGETISHVFTTDGDYIVVLTVSDGQYSDTATMLIEVSDGSVIADFTASSESGVVPLTVNFDASSSQDPTGGDLSYSWDFGNGQTATTEMASTEYTAIGDYTVTLIVTSSNGNSDTVSKTISVTEEIISDCAFGTPISTSLPGINSEYRNIFVLGNGGPDLSNVSIFTVNWDANNNALHQFSINTTNGSPDWWIDLRASSSQNFNATQPDITFSGSGFSGLDGSYWVGIDNGNFVLVSKTGGFTIYFSTSSTAPDCDNSSGGGNTDPVAVLDVTPESGLAPLQVSFDGTGSSDADGDPLSYTIDYGDETTGTGAISTHTYTTSGEYVVVLTVDDGNGGSDTDSVTITVLDDFVPGDCTFGTPISTSLQTINTYFENVHVLGTGGPNMDDVNKFTINWDLPNSGLYQFSFGLNVAPWYSNFSSATQNFNQSSPSITLTGTGIAGLDGDYYVAIDNGNFVLVADTYAIYFSNSATAPSCDASTSARTALTKKSLEAFDVSIYPNPSSNIVNVSLSGSLSTETVLVLTSILGKTIKTKKVDSNKISTEFDVNNLPKGIYLLKTISEGKQIKVKKLIVN